MAVKTSETTFGYDLRGRMTSVVTEKFAADGTTVTERETTIHGYDSAGTLVSTTLQTDRERTANHILTPSVAFSGW